MSDVFDQFVRVVVGITTTVVSIVILSTVAKATCENIEEGQFGYEVCGLIFETGVEAILLLSAVSSIAILLAVTRILDGRGGGR